MQFFALAALAVVPADSLVDVRRPKSAGTPYVRPGAEQGVVLHEPAR